MFDPASDRVLHLVITNSTGKLSSESLYKKMRIAYETYQNEELDLLSFDGESFIFWKEDTEMENMLIHLIKRAKLVIIGRMTPQQKASICSIARKHMKSKIMAMGDGQNDSPMI